MKRFTSLGLGALLLTVSLAVPMAMAQDTDAPETFQAYLEAAHAAGIQGQEQHVDALVPAGMALQVDVDLRTGEVTTSIVEMPSLLGTPGSDAEANCLVLDAGEDGGLTPGDVLNVESDDRPAEVPACQDDDTVHTVGTDEMRFVTAGDDEAMFRLQRDFNVGWGWVWIECSTSDTVANFAIGPYSDLNHADCYINNYGNPATWANYEAYVSNDHDQDPSVAYGSLSYVE